MSQFAPLLQQTEIYLAARSCLLQSLEVLEREVQESKVDPLTLLSEHLVARLYEGGAASFFASSSSRAMERRYDGRELVNWANFDRF